MLLARGGKAALSLRRGVAWLEEHTLFLELPCSEAHSVPMLTRDSLLVERSVLPLEQPWTNALPSGNPIQSNPSGQPFSTRSLAKLAVVDMLAERDALTPGHPNNGGMDSEQSFAGTSSMDIVLLELSPEKTMAACNSSEASA